MSKPSNQSLTNTVNSVKLGNRVAGGKKTLEKTHIWTISVVARKLTLVFLKMTSNEYSRSQKNGRLFCGKLGTRMAVVGRGFRSRREGLAENPVTNHPVASGPPKKRKGKESPAAMSSEKPDILLVVGRTAVVVADTTLVLLRSAKQRAADRVYWVSTDPMSAVRVETNRVFVSHSPCLAATFSKSTSPTTTTWPRAALLFFGSSSTVTEFVTGFPNGRRWC